MTERHFSTERETMRLEMFIDAILAIITTILILEFKVPEEPFSTEVEIKLFIHHLFPSFFSYGISFATIINLWIDHHLLCHLMKRANVQFVLLNFLFVLFLSPLPFTTALAGRNYESSFAVAMVATNYFMTSLSFSFLWRYAFAKKMVSESETKEKIIKRNIIIGITGSVLLLISIPLAFVSTYISFTVFIVVILMHLFKQFFR